MTTNLDRELMRHVTGPAPLGGADLPLPVRPVPPRHDRGIGQRVLAALGRAWRAVAVAQQSRATARALAVLGDRQLSDIGISRGNIPEVARQAAAAHLAVAGLTWSSAPVSRAINDNPRHRAA